MHRNLYTPKLPIPLQRNGTEKNTALESNERKGFT